MEETNYLFMVMLGCRPKGRMTEQHDIFFGIAPNLKQLMPSMKAFWPEAKGQIHIDAWRKITQVDGFSIEICSREENVPNENNLFFINLGGYKENEFEEYHYKVLTVAKSKAEAIKKSKKTTFFKHCGFGVAGASHIDDKFGVAIDDVFRIKDILAPAFKEKYSLKITECNTTIDDKLEIGYLKIDKILS
jgi:hypothetical protein